MNLDAESQGPTPTPRPTLTPVPTPTQIAISISDDRRARLLRRLEERLDAALKEEGLPAGLPPGLIESDDEGNPIAGSSRSGDYQAHPDSLPDRHCDQYAIWSSLTALLQETRLQGRAFRDLDASLQALIEQGIRGDAGMEFAAPPVMSPHEDPSTRALVDVLIDTRERLGRNLQSAEVALGSRPQPPRVWPWERSGYAAEEEAVATARALRDGIDLALQVLHDQLDRLGIVEIGGPGEPFDPDTMRAIEVRRTSDLPDGYIVDVIRTGYEWNGALLRPAEVRVARASQDN